MRGSGAAVAPSGPFDGPCAGRHRSLRDPPGQSGIRGDPRRRHDTGHRRGRPLSGAGDRSWSGAASQQSSASVPRRPPDLRGTVSARVEPSRLESRKRAQPLPPPVSLGADMKESLSTVTDDRQMLQKLARNSVSLGLNVKNSLYEVFHENTKLGRLSARAYSTWMVNFSRSRSAQQTLKAAVHQGQGYKVYTLMERRALPQLEARTPLERTIAARRSIRTFSDGAIGLEALARLLFFTYGRTDPRGMFRAVASGGALYPLELYVAAFKVDGLDPGIYHYGVETGHLDVVKPGDCLA